MRTRGENVRRLITFLCIWICVFSVAGFLMGLGLGGFAVSLEQLCRFFGGVIACSLSIASGCAVWPHLLLARAGKAVGEQRSSLEEL